MCGLCGMFESGRRWLDAAATLDPAHLRRERLRRVALVREVLKSARIAVDDWQGASFILRGPTGKTEIVDNLFDLWRKAEALGHRALDPLAQDFPPLSEDSGVQDTETHLADRASNQGERIRSRHYGAGAKSPTAGRSPLARLRRNDEPRKRVSEETQSPSDPASETAMRRIPVHVLTGFLGSGKTTLLNRMLRDPALSDSAVLINEIGAVAIDHHLVERMESGDGLDVIVFKGGCACCTLRGDLVSGLRELYARRATGMLPPFRRVVLETTGLADPAPVLFTLAGDPALRHKFEAGAVLATVDAAHGAARSARYPEWGKQVAIADRLVITNSDLSEPSQAAQLAALLARINPAAEIFDAWDVTDVGSLLARVRPISAPRPEPANALGSVRRVHGRAVVHTPDVDSVSIVLGEPLEWSELAIWLTRLLHAHGDRMLRFKALLRVQGWPTQIALDGVHHLIHRPRHMAAWPSGPRASRLVFITRGLQVEAIERSLRAWLIRHAAAPTDQSHAFASERPA